MLWTWDVKRVCPFPKLTFAYKVCRYEDDYRIKDMSEEDCNRFGCCEYRTDAEGDGKCFPKSDGSQDCKGINFLRNINLC